MYIKGYRGIGPTTLDINRCKIFFNSFNPLINYLKRLGSAASLPRLRTIYTKPRYKWSL